MPKTFRIEVFGKPGCDKCALLNKRLDQLLQDKKWQEFEKTYQSVESVDGLVAFTQTECMNPSRIPGFVVKAWDEQKQTYDYLLSSAALLTKNAGRNSLLRLYLGVETDYSQRGKGVLSPTLIQSVLEEAVCQRQQSKNPR